MRFGVGLPTCREGLAYPVPYARPAELATIARRAEALGFYSVWANDHLTTPEVVRATQATPPNFYEPLITYASLAPVTERLRLVVSVLVLPHREVVLLAKQIATLDVLSGGRVMLGVGIGAYREELEAVHPGLTGAHRGRLLEEGVQALRLLFTERRARADGTYVRFGEVELAPKPAQAPFPIYLSAHGPAALRRAGRIGDGLIVAALRPAAVADARRELAAGAAEGGRDPAGLSLHFQIWLALGRDRAAAEAKLERSQHFRRLLASGPGRPADTVLAEYRASNLLGGPDDVVEQLRAFAAAGVTHMGIVFLGETTDDLLADMALFAERVMPSLAPPNPAC
jgi:probable F420-dependent oxidoreductase